MSRRYDSRTTIFSPEGRLYQVEYAMEAISHAGSAVGILSHEGVVLAAERKQVNTLLEPSQPSQDKLFKIDQHIIAAVAGITSDANSLTKTLRQTCQQYRVTFQDGIPVEHLVQKVCNLKQRYTHFGGLRPFGVSLIYGGYDVHEGFQLYQSDPSGNYAGWKATVMGANSGAAQNVLKSDYHEGCSLQEASLLAVKVLRKSIGGSTVLKPERVELIQLKKDVRGKLVVYHATQPEIQKWIEELEQEDLESGVTSTEPASHPPEQPTFSSVVS